MPIGPGKYDAECTLVREITGAQGVILIIVGGDRGVGVSAQLLPADQMHLPEMLRDVARLIDESIKNG